MKTNEQLLDEYLDLVLEATSGKHDATGRIEVYDKRAEVLDRMKKIEEHITNDKYPRGVIIIK